MFLQYDCTGIFWGALSVHPWSVPHGWTDKFFFHERLKAAAHTEHLLFVSDAHRITSQTVTVGVRYDVPTPPHLYRKGERKNAQKGRLVRMEAWDGERARSRAEIALMKSLAENQPAARGRGAAISFWTCPIPNGTMSFRPWWPKTRWIVKVPPWPSSLLQPKAECNITDLTWMQTVRSLLPFGPACPSSFCCSNLFLFDFIFSSVPLCW